MAKLNAEPIVIGTMVEKLSFKVFLVGNPHDVCMLNAM